MTCDIAFFVRRLRWWSPPQYNSRFHHPKTGRNCCDPWLTAVSGLNVRNHQPSPAGRWLTYLHFWHQEIIVIWRRNSNRVPPRALASRTRHWLCLSTSARLHTHTNQHPRNIMRSRRRCANDSRFFLSTVSSRTHCISRARYVDVTECANTSFLLSIHWFLVWWPVLSTRTERCQPFAIVAHLLKDKK